MSNWDAAPGDSVRQTDNTSGNGGSLTGSDNQSLNEDRAVRRTEAERLQVTTAAALQPVTLTDAGRPDAPPAPEADTLGPDAPPPPGNDDGTKPQPRPNPPGNDTLPPPAPSDNGDPFLATPHRLDVQLQKDEVMKDQVNQMLLAWLVASIKYFPCGSDSARERREDSSDGKPAPQTATMAPKMKPLAKPTVDRPQTRNGRTLDTMPTGVRDAV